ncbi:testis-expressed protein 26 isoform X1 [Dendropsophus ebraccatus]|uniref:testis-expressed protein 26 isoform X1 n=1 Tax=Dendropsophus ebraccatus TaxID=150705 RepID=UPI0038318926
MITTQLDGDVLKPQFMEQLSYLKDKSKSLSEKEKCNQLAACLLISSKFSHKTKLPEATARTPPRPKTAMAALGGNIWDPYETTMNRDYPHKVCPPPVALRPKTSKSYRNPYYLCDPIGISMYNDEYSWKPYSKPEPIRAATASGARNNRPHPDKTFSAWKLPHEEKKISQDSYSPWIKPPTIEEVQRAVRSQYLSTYKGDYLGTPQGYQVRYAIDTSPNWRKDIPQPLATESRFNYQVQPHYPKLDDFTHKYGCYANRHLSVKGVVPTVTYSHIRNQENKKQLTTYQRHFGRNFLDLSALAHSMSPEEVASFLQNVPNEVPERRAMEKLLNTFPKADSQEVESMERRTKLNGR